MKHRETRSVRKRTKARKNGSEHRFWQATYSFIGDDNRRRRITATGTTRSAALTSLEQKKTKLKLAPRSLDDRRRLRAYAREWLDSVEALGAKAPTTTHRARTALAHLIEILGALEVRGLERRDIREAYARLAKNGLGLRTRTIAHQTLCQVLDEAVDDGLLAMNPARTLKVPKPARRTGDEVTENFLAPADLDRLIDACRTEPLGPVFELMARTGLRPGEALGLQWRDIDFEGGILSVGRQLRELRGQLEIAAEKTERSRRTVPLPAAAVAALKTHRAEESMRQARVLRRRKEAIRPLQSEDLVFRSRTLTPVRRKPLAAALDRLVQTAEVRRITPHGLRHSYATRLLTAGIAPIEVAAVIGDSVDTLLKVYAHACLADEERSRERITQALARCE